MSEFKAPVGTRDVLPPESARWVRLVGAFARRAELAGFGLIVGPMFEDIGVFERVGDSTDIVRKEMYDFHDKHTPPRHLALRPEGTAGVVRAFVEHRPTPPWKVWYVAPNFRYERAQTGRYRQHHQVGVEVLGTDDPDCDVEVLALLDGFFRVDLGLRNFVLNLNSLGDATCRPGYRDALLAYLTERRDQLCDEHRDRIEVNPLRVLDCKRDACRDATRGARRARSITSASRAPHISPRVRAGLDALGIGFELDSRLVRGLDYYTRTTFEFASGALESAQNAIGGGGRYDGLAEALGGPATPGIGFGSGIERVLLACDAEGTFDTGVDAGVDVFVIDTTGGEAARDVVHALRVAGVAADRAYDNRSWKAQMKFAERSGARYAVSIEPDRTQLRTLLERAEPDDIALDDIVEHVKKRLADR